MKKFRSLILLLCSLSAVTATLADRLVTTRKHLSPKQTEPELYTRLLSAADTIINPGGTTVSFYGYEKTLSSTCETLFITNQTDSTIARLVFTINYLDKTGRQIHTRQINTATQSADKTPLTIPPRSTRRFDLPSWDKQKSYYYINGKQPRSAATPYSVTLQADTLLLSPACN